MPDRCWCSRRALEDLLAEARRWPVRETGGALLGWRDGIDAVIADVLGPGPDAKHGFSSFEPDAIWQNAQGRRIYEESGRTIAYLGDWHTHPHGTPRPSRQDRRTAKQIAEDSGFRAPRCLYGIAAKRGYQLRARHWSLTVYGWNGEELVETDLRLFDG